MIGKDQREAQHNTVHSLNVFYNRPDIKCVFPEKISDLNLPGLVCVTDFKRPPGFNYMRVVANESGRGRFLNVIQPKLHLHKVWESMYSAPIIYVTNHWAAPQYKSKFGIPDFWEMKKGNYKFGWKVYEFNGVPKWKSKYKKSIYKRQPIEWKSLNNKIEPLPVCPSFSSRNVGSNFTNIYNLENQYISLSEIKNLKNLRALIYGDSIARATAFGYYAWHQQVKRWSDKKLKNCNMNFINSAMSGDSTLQLSPRLYSDVIAKRPQIVFILITRSEKWRYNYYNKNRK